MRNLYLVGFMGTGKTAVGKAVSKKLKMHFIDLDLLIEKKLGKTIREVFEKQGEAFFRKEEKQALKAVALNDSTVVSCGGGIVVDEENIEIMKKSGIMICLKSSAEKIYERCRKNKDRPLLNVKDPLKKINELLGKRAEFYALSNHCIDTTNISVEKAADDICALLKK